MPLGKEAGRRPLGGAIVAFEFVEGGVSEPGCPETEMMELDVPTAIRAQLVTLSDDERSATLSRLELLAQDPDRLGTDVHNSTQDAQLWTVRLSGRMRALVRAEGNKLRVLAVAPREQLLPYLAPNGKRAA
jgi:hypothetical protein